MKKINKTSGQNALTQFAAHNPSANWDSDFKSSNGGADYQTIRTRIFEDQGGLCAYCETKVNELPAHKQRIEHFHPKSDASNPAKNWALDWDNIFGVCIGGSDANKGEHPLPQNLSCDSHKDHWITRGKRAKACEGYLINPLDMIASPCLFDLVKRTGELTPHVANCAQFEFDINQTGSTVDLVQKTIEILNLNCDRLIQQRLAVLHEYNHLIKRARQQNDRHIFGRLASRWFQIKWPSFFTTRRIILDNHADVYLAQTAYNG